MTPYMPYIDPHMTRWDALPATVRAKKRMGPEDFYCFGKVGQHPLNRPDLDAASIHDNLPFA